MKGDFARVTFDPALHYSQVFQQQGRMLLEADWNEQASIQLDLLRTLVADLVGPCWAVGDGFGIAPQPHLADWQLAAGHFYVDGILCVNDQPCTLAGQPFAPTPDFPANGGPFANPPATFALWLDVWERHLCAVEVPGLADVALNGIDTASRAQVVWQVRLLDLDQGQGGASLEDIRAALDVRLQAATTDADTAAVKQQIADLDALRKRAGGKQPGNDDPCAWLRGIVSARATYAWPALRAQLGPVESDNDPCVIAADARYRGCENQLYRVEIHQGGLAGTRDAPSGTSFKWSRENGSVIFPVLASESGTAPDGSGQVSVTLAHLGRDERLGLAVNDWVELVDDDYTLAQRASALLQVATVDATRRMATLAVPKNVTPYLPDPKKRSLLRRWDQRDAVTAQGTAALVEGTPITLEDGIQVTFEPGGVYATGDYWLIPARVANNGSLDWPPVSAVNGAARSRGMHHYAVLGGTDPDGAFGECCCRFDSLCALMQAGVIRRPDGRPVGGALRLAAPAKAARKSRPSKAGKTASKRATRKATAPAPASSEAQDTKE